MIYMGFPSPATRLLRYNAWTRRFHVFGDEQCVLEMEAARRITTFCPPALNHFHLRTGDSSHMSCVLRLKKCADEIHIVMDVTDIGTINAVSAVRCFV